LGKKRIFVGMVNIIVALTILIAGYLFIKAAIFFIAGFYRFLKPMFIMLFKGTDAGLQSEVEKTKEFKRFEDELNNML
jgi:hypothetical protein